MAEMSAPAPAPGKLRILRLLGPGLVTGASDDDPSGIATYAQAGAQFGYGLGWTLILSYPLMSAIQEASALLGRATGRGLASNISHRYPPIVGYCICLLLLVANTINAAANLGAIAASVHLLVGGATSLYVAVAALISAATMTFASYAAYARLLKWLCLSLLSYVGTIFAIDLDWSTVLRDLVLPRQQFSHDYILMLVAIFGTTISPYLFFWQASQEAERQEQDPLARPLVKAPEQTSPAIARIRIDTYVGMAISNIIGLFIVVTAAATLHAQGTTNIQTSADAAEALRPIAGDFAFALFAAGIVGTGMLSIPVLIGSAAFAICGVSGKACGLARKPAEAPHFYAVIAGIFIIAVALNLIDIDPVRALVWSAVINGIVAVPVMVLILLLARDRRIVREATLGGVSAFFGWCATFVMAGMAILLLIATVFDWA